MKTRILLSFALIITVSFNSYSQFYLEQYFDGADTNDYSIKIQIDTSLSNIWQIGKPKKAIFDSAATKPNVIITDTSNYYPKNNVSFFEFGVKFLGFNSNYGISVLQWEQKLDMDQGLDGGIVEYSTDSGKTWNNVFNNPYIYNFFGSDPKNSDTLPNGQYAFSGTDSNWRDIWLCFDDSYFSTKDTLSFRFTIKSDSINNNKEGWMIDNLIARQTIRHTVDPADQITYLNVYPTITTDGIVHIEAQKISDFHIIESIELINIEGKLIKKYGSSPTKFFIDVSPFANGVYFLKVNTNIKSETFKIIINK